MRATQGCASSHSAMICAFSQCRRRRAGSVLIPCKVSQASKGAWIEPTVFRISRKRSASAASLVASEPPTVALCPSMYFVVESTEMSAPSSSGRCRTGVRKVLSTASSRPWRLVISAMAAMSVRVRIGLAGVSMKTMRV